MDFAWTVEQETRYENILKATSGLHADGPQSAGNRGPGYGQSWVELGELGLLGAAIPEDRGGQGHGALDTARMFEAFGRGTSDTGLVFAAGAHLLACTVPVARFGSSRVTARLLPRLCSGELVAGNAMTEEDAGSDVSTLATTAREVPGGYLVDGTKSFVSNGPVADVLVAYATTDPSAGHLGQTAFVIDAASAGVECSEPFAKMGLDSVPAGTVTFRECFVPAENVLGVPGNGAAVFQYSMGWERTCLFAGYLGLVDRIIDDVCDRVRSRRQFGRPLADFQAVSHRVADMKLRAESARLLLYRACWEIDRGERAELAIALSKLAVSEGAVSSALDAIRLFGAEGYRMEAGIEKTLRDSIPSLLFSGASEIQRNVITRELGL